MKFILIPLLLGLAPLSIAENTKWVQTKLFSAKWCGQCKRLDKDIQSKISNHILEVEIDGQTYKTKLEMVDVSDRKVWKEKEKTFGEITGVPNLLVELDGKVLKNNIRLDIKESPTVEDIKNALVQVIKHSAIQ